MTNYPFNGGSMYNDPEIRAWDAEFTNQLNMQARSNTVTVQVLQIVQNEWERQKMQIIANARQRIGQYGTYNNAAMQTTISEFIRSVIQACAFPQNTYGMPAMQMQQNPYVRMGGMMPYQTPMPGYATPQAPMYSGLSGVTPFQSGICTPQQTTSAAMSSIYVNPNTKDEQKQPTATNQDANAQAPDAALHVTKQPIAKFSPPKLGEADQLYGTEEHETSIGKIKVTSMISECDGLAFKYVTVKLYDPCRDELEVLQRVKQLIDISGPVHIDITYDKIVKLKLRPDDLNKILSSMKKSISACAKAANKLRYLNNLVDRLNKESHGVYDALETFYVDRFITEARTGLISSDYPKQYTLNEKNLSTLIELANLNTKSKEIAEWQKMPGFNDRMISICEYAIKHAITDMTVFDPSKDTELPFILKMNTGLVEVEDGSLIDLTANLVEKLAEYTKATYTQKCTDFGEAGKIVANTSVAVLHNERMTYTTLLPLNFTTEYPNGATISDRTLSIGGYADAEATQPNDADNLFEYMMTHNSVADSTPVDLIIGCGGRLFFKKCTLSTDRWIVITEKQN